MDSRLTAEEIFYAAREKADPAERAGFLDGACRNDVSVRAKVEALLKADAQAGEFLRSVEKSPPSSPSVAPTLASTPCDQAGDMFGRYKMLQQIGEGGFGTVWMAEQRQPVKRRVALKIIKLGMDSRQVIARFEAERQALAMMDHPHIAKVFDAGSTETGRLYFVMEYIKGVPILEYCDKERLHTKQRLDLFTKVCQAIQHAHQKGIIHRDIKPSNVLITLHDGVPVPKVIDFGIAKATSAELTTWTLFTEHRQMIGTPAYMSPEQAEMSGLDIDTRSDIYSLGVLLYELLTGTTPFDTRELMSKGFAEMMRIIREVEPHKPSTRLSSLGEIGTRTAQQRRTVDANRLCQSIKGDLDWIVMKCLEKDRTRRYETANGLAADVKRHLNDEPVVASPPSAAYRFQKFVRRNKGPVVAGLLVAIVLVLGVISTTGGLMWALREKNRADVESTNAKLAAQAEARATLEAQRKREEAEQNLEYAKKGNAILGSVFENLNPRQDYATVAELRSALKASLATAMQELQGSAIGDPLVVAEMQTTLGNSLTSLGDAEQAIPLLVSARDTRQALLGPEDPATLQSMNDLAVAYWEVGNLDLAVPLAEETLQRRNALLGADDADTLASMNNLACIYWKASQLDKSIPLFEEVLKRVEATSGRNDPAVILAIGNLGENYKDAGRIGDAIPLLEEALTRWSTARGPDHPDTLIAMTNLAQGYEKAGRLDLALPRYEETVERCRERLGPDHPHTLKTVNSLAYAYWLAGQYDKSFPLYEDKLNRLEATLGPDDPETLDAAANLGGNYNGAGRFEDAIHLLEETLSLAKSRLGPEHPTTLCCMNNLAGAYLGTMRPDKSIPLLEQILKSNESTNGKDDPQTLETATSLGIAYRDAGQPQWAIPLLEDTLAIEKNTLGLDHLATLRCLSSLAQAYQSADEPDRALPLFQEALDLQKSRLGSDHPVTLATMNNFATALSRATRLDRSIPMFEELRSRQQTTLGPDHPFTLATGVSLGADYISANRLDDAIRLLDETLELSKERLGPDHPTTQRCINDLALTLWRVNRLDRSIPLFEEILAQHEETLGRDHPDTFSAMSNLGINYKDARRLDEAIPLLEEAYQASAKYPLLRMAGPYLLDAYVNASDPADPDDTARIKNLIEKLVVDSYDVLPNDSLALAGQLAWFGQTLLALNAWDQAEPLIRESLTIREKAQPDVWTTFNSKSMLGEALLARSEFAKAEPLLIDGYEGMKQREVAIPAQGKVRITEALERLVRLYAAWNLAEPGKGYDEKAEQWRAKLE